jgi:O-6-methylguanine DNA methyltransferase
MATEKCAARNGTVSDWEGSFMSGDTRFRMGLEATDAGITACRLVALGRASHGSAICAGKGTDRPEKADELPSHPHLRTAVGELREYFAGSRNRFTVPLALSGTDFQKHVWRAARQIPHGQTRSYWWVAVRAGNPRAMRAVGGAMRANPIPIFIPCHRVVRQDGGLGGFSAGLEWKRQLLALEAQYSSLSR